MTIDLNREPLIPFVQVPNLACIPHRRRNRPLNVATVHRWHRKGVRGVRLEAVRVGGTLCTSVAALQRFFDRLADTPEQSAKAPSKRHEQLDAVDRELDAAGL